MDFSQLPAHMTSGLVVLHTTTEWNTLNPILSKGTLCLENKGSGLYSFKVADGVKTWSNLTLVITTDAPMKMFTGIIGSGLDTVILPWSISDITDGVILFLDGIRQQPSTLTLVNSKTIKIGDVVTKDTTVEVIVVPSILKSYFYKYSFNFVIDGDFDFWYEGTTQSTSGYGSDTLWYNLHAGSTKVHSRQSFAIGEVFPDGIPCPAYYSRTVVTSVAGSANCCYKFQRIEDLAKLAGKTITLSFYAKADSNKNIAIELYQATGSGGSSDIPAAGVQSIALTTSWKKYTVSFQVPNITGVTLGTAHHTSLVFWFDAGSNYNSRTNTLGQQSGTFDISTVRLVEGNDYTLPIERTIADELNLLNRYFVQLTFNSVLLRPMSGLWWSTVDGEVTYKLKVPMRIQSVIFSYSSLSHFYIHFTNNTINPASLVLNNGMLLTNCMVFIVFTAASQTGATGKASILDAVSAGSWLRFDARL